MAPRLRPILLGFFSWFLPFAVSFVLFPIRKSNPPLFSTFMFLAVLIVAGLLLKLYFFRRAIRLGEAILVGLLWLAMNLIFDYPMFAFGPMKMTVAAYYSEIGLVYLTFPLFALLAIPLARRP
ncbi:MAG TPA: hypothetical protein VMD29_15845 [Terracidiphilus sp.]|nr:hypothetical protein [Terracidiphilus sp.]